MMTRTHSFRRSMFAAVALLVFQWSCGALAGTDEGRPFTRGELYGYIVGKTQTLSDGGAFYADDGTLQVLRGEKLHKGSWSTKKTGELCWHIYDLGEMPCGVYLHGAGDNVLVLLNGVTNPAPERQDGNALSEAQPDSESQAAAKTAASSAANRKLFTLQETIAFLSGKTTRRHASGRMYYGPDFTLKTVWNGVHKTGTWSVDENGGVCWQVVGWGPTPCEYYFYKKEGGILWALFRGRATAAAQHVEGDETEN